MRNLSEDFETEINNNYIYCRERCMGENGGHVGSKAGDISWDSSGNKTVELLLL